MNDTKSFIYIKQMYMKGFFSYNRKDRLRRSLELRNARMEAGMTNR